MYDNVGAMKKIRDVLAVGAQFNEIKDVDVLLEEVLSRAREVLCGDAGSVYVVEGSSLAIHCSQNDTLQAKLPSGEKLIYSYFKIPINTATISGYCVATRSEISINDVYKIPNGAPYSFNTSYDQESGYRTKSVIAAPLISNGNEILGAIQIINKVDSRRRIVQFDRDDVLLIKHFASYVSSALQRAQITRALLLRMMKMAELRDPKETYHHVNRVGAYATELFERWATIHSMHPKTIQKSKDTLRMAAMLHDVGKVAISDTILKKPGRYNKQEREIIKSHTYLGARLFINSQSELDEAAQIVSMNHHENWDGSGYPGYVDIESATVLIAQRDGLPSGKSRYDIPLFGRIVSICDVYDALRSHRVYKEGWSIEDTLAEMHRMSGVKFDPELFDIFLMVLPNIKALEEKYSADQHNEPQSDRKV